MKKKNDKNKNPKNEAIKWFFTIFIITFVLSMTFSYVSTTSINGLATLPALIVLIVVILVGVAFVVVVVVVAFVVVVVILVVVVVCGGVAFLATSITAV